MIANWMELVRERVRNLLEFGVTKILVKKLQNFNESENFVVLDLYRVFV